jgi:hypothetical protein
MKSKKITVLALLALGLGSIGLALRWLLYRDGFDGRSLLTAGNPLNMGCWILFLVAAVVFFLFLRKEQPYDQGLFQKSLPAAVMSLVSGIGLVVYLLGWGIGSDLYTRITLVLGYLAAAGMIAGGWFRLRGQVPFLLGDGAICLFWCTSIIYQYRVWSAAPQVQDYALPLLGCVMLALSAMYRTNVLAGVSKEKKYLFTSLMAVTLCCLSLIGPQEREIYLWGGLWTLSNLLPIRSVQTQEAAPEEGV